MKLHDLHLHTTYSDGKSPVEQMIQAAIAMELEYIGFSDHYRNGEQVLLGSRISNGLINEKNNWIDAVKKDIANSAFSDSIRILRGAEVKINTNGQVRIEDSQAAKLDYIIVEPCLPELNALQGTRKKFLRAIRKMLINSVSSPIGNIYAHPFNFGRLNIALKLNDFDKSFLKEFAAGLVENNKFFEIMNNVWYWWPNIHPHEFTEEYKKIIAVFADEGVMFSLGSDAHSVGGAGNLVWSLKMVRECGIEKQIINPEILRTIRKANNDKQKNVA